MLSLFFFSLIDLQKNEEEELSSDDKVQEASFPPQKRNLEQQKRLLNMF